MTILFAGGEMDSFSPADALTKESTTAAAFDSNFARCAIHALGSGTYAATPTFTSTTNIWCHSEIYGSTNAFTDNTVVALFDSGGTARVRLLVNSSSSDWTLQHWNGAAWVTDDTLNGPIMSSRQILDINAVVNSASGNVKVYFSGTERMDSGTIDLSGATNIASAKFYGASTSGGGVTSQYHSQIIIADQTTIGMRLMTAHLSGAGSNTEWSSGAYSSLDEIIYDDTDFISSGTVNQVQMMATTLQAALTGYTIVAVAVGSRAKRDASGPQNLQLGVRVASTNYFSSTKALGLAYAPICNVWNTSPATSAAWTSSEVSSLQAGDKSIT